MNLKVDRCMKKNHCLHLQRLASILNKILLGQNVNETNAAPESIQIQQSDRQSNVEISYLANDVSTFEHVTAQHLLTKISSHGNASIHSLVLLVKSTGNMSSVILYVLFISILEKYSMKHLNIVPVCGVPCSSVLCSLCCSSCKQIKHV